MPAPIVVGDTSGLAQGIQTAGSALAQGLGQWRQRNQQQEQQEKLQQQQLGYNTILGKTLGSLDETSSPMDAVRAANRAIEEGVPVDQVQKAYGMYDQIMKAQLQEQQDAQLLRNLGLMPGEGPGEQPIQQPQQPQPFVPGISQPQQMQQPQPQQQQIQPLAQPQQLQQPQTGLSQLSDDQLVMMQSSRNPRIKGLGDAEQKRRAAQDKRFTEDRKYHTAKTKKFEEEISNIRKGQQTKKLAFSMAKDAVDSGEIGAFSLANLAQRTGIKELQTAKGSQLITASKEFLLGNMNRVSARAQNVWFEKRLASMFPQIGQSEEANRSAMIMLEGEEEMNKILVDTYDRLAQDDIEKYGYIKDDIESRVYNQSDNEMNDVLNKVMYRERINYENEQGEKGLLKLADQKAPKGAYLTPQMYGVIKSKFGLDQEGTIKRAKQLGYQIPSQQELKRWL